MAESTAESVPTIQPSAFDVPKMASALPSTSGGAVILTSPNTIASGKIPGTNVPPLLQRKRIHKLKKTTHLACDKSILVLKKRIGY
jgi:hypothetical protein